MVEGKKPKIAVIGGGIAGSTIALYLSEIGQDVTLFEKGPSLVNGPPICHLHAGGNLYREISDEQCLTLLRESIDLVRFYPNAVDYRPTVIAVPTQDSGSPDALYKRLNLLKEEYQKLITLDINNKVLGESSDYYKLFSRLEVENLQKLPSPKSPKTLSEWMIPVAKNIDLDTVQFPLIMVQEYGLNLFRLAATATLTLKTKDNCNILLNHLVTNIEKKEQKWCLSYQHEGVSHQEAFDFLINAAGFRTGNIDDMLGYTRERFVEFKAAYVTQWETPETRWPEVVFYGERGTPKGMAQFTPYPEGHFQLHGMTKSVTLFEEGLVKSSPLSAQPKLGTKFIDKIDKSWRPQDIQIRSRLAIEHLAQYIPAFKTAKVVSKPLYGAQQIPGDDADLRAANVSFVDKYYVRCEIVKASSVLSMADTITDQLIALGFVEATMKGKRDFKSLYKYNDTVIGACAKQLTLEREYPPALSKRIVSQD